MSKQQDASDTKKLEEKLDLVIEELNKSRVSRKREHVLSKIDGLYNILIALSTFIIGIIISQRFFGVSDDSFKVLLTLAQVVLTLIFSYAIGFVGMVKDSVDLRILSWGTLLTSFLFVLYVNVIPWEALFATGFWSGALLLPVVGTIVIFLIMGGAYKIVDVIEAKYTSLIGQKTKGWKKIKVNVMFEAFGISGGVFVTAVIVASIIRGLASLP